MNSSKHIAFCLHLHIWKYLQEEAASPLAQAHENSPSPKITRLVPSASIHRQFWPKLIARNQTGLQCDHPHVKAHGAQNSDSLWQDLNACAIHFHSLEALEARPILANEIFARGSYLNTANFSGISGRTNACHPPPLEDGAAQPRNRIPKPTHLPIAASPSSNTYSSKNKTQQRNLQAYGLHDRCRHRRLTNLILDEFNLGK